MSRPKKEKEPKLEIVSDGSLDDRRYEDTEEYRIQQEENKKLVAEMAPEMKFHMLMKGLLDAALAGENVMFELGDKQKGEKVVTFIALAGEYSEELMHQVMANTRLYPLDQHDENGNPIVSQPTEEVSDESTRQ